MPSLRVDTTPGHPDVPEQKLQHRRGVDELNRVGVLRPTERVEDGAGAACPPRRADDLGSPFELGRRASANRRDLRRRIASVVLPQESKHRPRVLEALIDPRKTARVALVLPRRFVVAPRRGVPSRKEAALEIEAFGNDEGRIGVLLDVVRVMEALVERVVDETARIGA